MFDDLFDPSSKEDMELIHSAIKIDANMHYALYATLLAKRHLKFPIKSYKSLAPLFSKGSLMERGPGRKVSLADAKRFMTAEFFPILDLHDFLAKTYHCLYRGDMAHYQEAIAQDPLRAYPAVLLKTERLAKSKR